jgi:hypothetical protein
MKLPIHALAAAAFLLAASPLLAQETGTSHPEALNDSVSTIPEQPSTPRPATVAPAPALHTHATEEVFVAEPRPTVPAPSRTAPLAARDHADDGIVTVFPGSATELTEGTLLKVRLNETISTLTTHPGARFTAQLVDPIEREGKVLFPAGSTLTGHVTALHGGRRVGGAAAIHLEPESITLPDGMIYHLSAQVIDLEPFRSAHVTSEGTIVHNDHNKGKVAALALTTGSAAAAGGVIGGVPGAAIGAGIGAGVGVIWWLKQDQQQILDQGTRVVFSLNRTLNLLPGNSTGR